MRRYRTGTWHALVPLLGFGLMLGYAPPAQAQSFEETALFILSMGQSDRMADPATGLVAKDENIEETASFVRETCSVRHHTRTLRPIQNREWNFTLTAHFGHVNPASIVRKPFFLRGRTPYEADRSGISFIMTSGNGKVVCERDAALNGEVVVPDAERAMQCGTTIEIQVRPEVAPRVEAAINHLFSKHCPGVRRAF